MNLSKVLSVVFLVSAVVWMTSCTEPAGNNSKEVTITSEMDSVSYAIGVLIASNVKKDFDDINQAAFDKGFSEVLEGNESAMEPQAANALVMEYLTKQKKVEAEENLKEAEDFLAKNKDKEGVKTTESGLQYKVLKEGTGSVPTASDMVKVYYKGTLIDGTPFDSTKMDNPAQFRVNGVIKGWTEALQMMHVGGKWMLYIPPELGYGENPRQGGVIKPNDLLIFEIELLEIVKK